MCFFLTGTELLDYIMLCVTYMYPVEKINRKLHYFLGKNTELFSAWLVELLLQLKYYKLTRPQPLEASVAAHTSPTVIGEFSCLSYTSSQRKRL